jgi:ribonuclease HI
MLEIYFAGISTYDQGPSGCGFVIIDKYQDYKKIYKKYKYLGTMVTQDEAEYHGLIEAFNCLIKIVYKRHFFPCFYGNNDIIKNMSGNFKLRSDNLKVYYAKAKELEKQLYSLVDKPFDTYKFEYIVINNNDNKAIILANMAIDKYYDNDADNDADNDSDNDSDNSLGSYESYKTSATCHSWDS